MQNISNFLKKTFLLPIYTRNSAKRERFTLQTFWIIKSCKNFHRVILSSVFHYVRVKEFQNWM